MIGKPNEFRPDYATPPGTILEELLEAKALSLSEVARRCGRSPKLLSEIVAGKAPVEPDTAVQLERVLGLDASIWLQLETAYQLFRAKASERDRLAPTSQWVDRFPVKDLTAMGVLEEPTDKINAAQKLLAFFGVGTVDAWSQRYERIAVCYRHSPAFKSSNDAIIVWLRVGELYAERQSSADFDSTQFMRALREIRKLTTLKIQEFQPLITKHCNSAGVAFALVPPLPKTALSGAARWLTPRKALIQQSLRHKSNDHFWFTFFHEAAHILLHSKKAVFVDEVGDSSNSEEKEANEWAAQFLVDNAALDRFIATSQISEPRVRAFASEQGIDPGIVVGMLQHRGVVSWRNLNSLKRRYEWKKKTAKVDRAG